MKVSSAVPGDEIIDQKLNVTIPKSPSFHSGLDLVAGAGSKYVNISKFNFVNDMNGNNNNTVANNQQTIFSFTKVCALDSGYSFSRNFINLFQFFTQSNPLNNLNISSSIPPLLQRPNSATDQQQQKHIQQLRSQSAGNERNAAQSVSTSNSSTTSGEIHRKYSLPMNTMPKLSASFNPLLARKQSAPNIQPISAVKQLPHSSPSRARDRNNFDKVPTAQDVQQLPLLKG